MPLEINHTTPLEREILQHYWCYPTQWKGGSSYWAPAAIRAIRRFVELGLLVPTSGVDVEANPDALRRYMDALAAVPLPVKVTQWIIPDKGDEG